MKNIKRLIVLMLLIIPGVASAASSNISITSASTGVVGNNLNVTATVSSSAPLGSWQFTISYDRSLLTLSSVSNTDDCGTNSNCAGNANNGSTKSKSYNFTFKVLKSGSTTIRITSSDVFGWDETRMTVNNGSRTVSLKTQAEIEASYSSDATLKGITVGDYTLDPEFNKDTYEYNVEVPNEVEKVTINATKNDANASVSGAGEKELEEGNNKVEIVVTAQKGNSLTYVVNVNRKELDPIKVTLNGKEYRIVRKKEQLPELVGFVQDTTMYNDTEIPSLYNEALTYRLVGVKDDDNNVYTYLYDEGAKEIRDQYIQIKTDELVISPQPFGEKYLGYTIKEFEIDGCNLFGLALSDKQVIIQGINPLNKETSIYLYDIDTKTFIPFNLEGVRKINKNIKIGLIIIGLLVLIVFLLILLNIFKKNKKKEKKVQEKPIIDEFKEIKEEEKEEVIKEEVIGMEKKKPKKVPKKKEQIEAENKRLKELEKERKEVEEELKKKDEEEVEDPLDSDDDFMDFWETMEIKTTKKK